MSRAIWLRKTGHIPRVPDPKTDQVGLLADVDGNLFTVSSTGVQSIAAGEVGAKGPIGDKGPMGDAGPQGPVGETGLTGDKGPAGDKGVAGDKGPVGDQGPVGEQGPQGEPGPDGAAGPDGQPGADGATGPTGNKGPTGDKGLTGDTGLTGPTGEQGPAGGQGPIGDKGPTGDKGPVGDKGATGDAGTAISAWPVGSLFFSSVSTNPATLLGFGTWVAYAQGRMILGWNTGDTAETTGGSATHTHAGHSDHAALTHAGAAVANHAFTQPTATGEAAHTHTYTQVPNHVHVERLQGGTTGTTTGTHLMGSAATGGSLRSSAQSTLDPTGGVATGTSAAGASHTHTLSGGAVDEHGVTQPSQHAAQSHSAHDSPSSLPPYVIAYIWKRTA